MSSDRNRRAAIALALVLLLLAVMVVAVSCGKNESSSTTEQSQMGEKTGDATIDGYLEQLDSQMNSVNPDDFDQQQLSDDQLDL